MRNRIPISLVALLLLATACSDGSPVTPEDPLTRVAAATVTTCDAGGVRSGISRTLLDRSSRNSARGFFDTARSSDGDGDHAAARVSYYSTLNVVLGARAMGRTKEPPALTSREALNGVEGLARALYRCAGDAAPAGLGDILALPPAVNDGNHTICTGAGDIGTTCVIPTQRVAVVAEPGFLRSPALFVLEPTAAYVDPALEAAYGTQWSRAWSARVIPITAQANYGVNSPNGASAVVAVCVDDRLVNGVAVAHPARSLLQIATRPEDVPGATPQLLPVQSIVDGQDVTALLECAHDGGPIASRSLLDRFRVTAQRMLSPRPLYAFDGGIGGHAMIFLSYYAAVKPPTQLFVFVAPLSSNGNSPRTPVVNGTLTLAAGSMAQLLVSNTGDSFAAASGCTWSYRPPDAAGAVRLFSNAILAQHAGTSRLRATCDAGTVDLDVVVN